MGGLIVLGSWGWIRVNSLHRILVRQLVDGKTRTDTKPGPGSYRDEASISTSFTPGHFSSHEVPIRCTLHLPALAASGKQLRNLVNIL